MKTPPSPYFSTVSLTDAFNLWRAELPDQLSVPVHGEHLVGEQTIRGIPFQFGAEEGENVVLLEREAVTIELGGRRAAWLVFVHAVRDATDMPGYCKDWDRWTGPGRSRG